MSRLLHLVFASQLALFLGAIAHSSVVAQPSLLTFADVKMIAPRSQDQLAQALADASAGFADAGISTRLRMAHFVTQVMTETGGLSRLDENMNYSYETLMRVFSRRTVSEIKARELGALPTRDNIRARSVANWVYGGRPELGNLGRDTDDGWNYRGSGFIQLTGRANFRARGAEVGLSLEDSPELARQPREGLVAAIAYWTARNINSVADDHDRLRVRRLVNGEAAHGYEQSLVWFNRAWTRVFRDKEALGFEGAVALAESTEAADETELFQDILESAGVVPRDLPATEAGDATRSEALKAYQRELGLPETGMLDEATQDALLDPREWRHREADDLVPVRLPNELDASIRFDFNGTGETEAGAVALSPKEGTGTQVATTNMSPELQTALVEASAAYSEYEMSYGKLVQEKRAPATPDGFVSFSVIEPDTREVVSNTTTYPDRAVVQILFNNGLGRSLCSGSMVAADTVLTAAHCIHSGTISGHVFDGFVVVPGRNGGATPFGQCGVTRAYVLSGWVQSLTSLEARYHDLGALKLDCRVGEATGWLGVRVLGDGEVGIPTRVQGYAADLDQQAIPGRQYASEDKLRILWELKGFYQNDTYGGTSGAPATSSGDPSTVIGVHTNGLHGDEPWISHNAFTRITPTRLDQISQWVED